MAKQQSEEEIKIRSRARRRLIGAAALALVVVVVLPMVLDREPRVTGRDIDLRIPAPDKVGEFVPGVALSKVVDQAEQAQSAAMAASAVGSSGVAAVPAANRSVGKIETRPAEPPGEETQKSEPQKAEPEMTDVQKPAAKKIETKKAEPKKVEPAATVKYIVQVGAFSKPAAAKQEADRLNAMGFKAHTEVISGTTRVRLGPYADRGKADAVRRSLEKHDMHPVVREAE